MNIISAGKILFPRSKFMHFAEFFPGAMELAQLHSKESQAMFLAQTGIESRMYTEFKEGLYYRPERIMEVFNLRVERFRMPRLNEKDMPVFRDGLGNAEYYARSSRKFANYVYANREGNGNEASGDGYRYAGKGPIQITLKNNYVAIQAIIGPILGVDIVKDPDLLLLPREGLYAAAAYWKMNNINRYADHGLVKKSTGLINKAHLHLNERTNLYNKAIKLLK